MDYKVHYGTSIILVPYEYLNIKYRKSNHIIESYSIRFNKLSEELADLFDSNASIEEKLKKINEMKTFLLDYQSKINRISEVLTDTTTDIIERSRYIDPLSKNDPESWEIRNKKFINILITNELLNQGYLKTAQIFAETRLEPSLYRIEFELSRSLNEIIEALNDGDMTLCLKWCVENRSKLKRLNNTLETRVRILEFASQIKSGDFLNAFSYVKKHFSKVTGQSKHLIEDALCLFASNPANSSAFSRYFNNESSRQLIPYFIDGFKSIHGIQSSVTDFIAVLKSGLIAFKTYSCGSDSEHFNIECPACAPFLSNLCLHVPFTSRTSSVVVCRMLKQRVPEDEKLIITPDGYLYSEKGVLMKQNQVTEDFHCPATKNTYSLVECSRVYLMI